MHNCSLGQAVKRGGHPTCKPDPPRLSCRCSRRCGDSLAAKRPCQNTSLEEDGLFNMDIALVLPDGSKLAVEVDGPQHVMSNKTDVPTDATLLRNFLLESRGWRVVSIPVTQWADASRHSHEANHEYLRRVMKS
jgi:hypothetical protein